MQGVEGSATLDAGSAAGSVRLKQLGAPVDSTVQGQGDQDGVEGKVDGVARVPLVCELLDRARMVAEAQEHHSALHRHPGANVELGAGCTERHTRAQTCSTRAAADVEFGAGCTDIHVHRQRAHVPGRLSQPPVGISRPPATGTFRQSVRNAAAVDKLRRPAVFSAARPKRAAEEAGDTAVLKQRHFSRMQLMRLAIIASFNMQLLRLRAREERRSAVTEAQMFMTRCIASRRSQLKTCTKR